MRKPKVFISYSAKGCPPGSCSGAGQCPICDRAQKELAFVQLLSTELTDFEIVYDRKILYAGQEWRPTLYQALGACDAAIIALTDSAADSSYVPLEAMILTWRRLLHPNFVVIPVFFAGFSVDSLRLPTSRYHGIGLEDIQGATHHSYSDEATTVDAIKTGLAGLGTPGSVNEIAVLDSLAAIFQPLDEHFLDSAKDHLPGSTLEWEPVTPKAYQLAAAILQRPLAKLIPSLQAILPEIYEPGKRKRLFELLSPQWVNPRAAIPIWRYALAGKEGSPSRVLLINGKERETCNSYVRRAWGHSASHPYHIVPLVVGQTPPGPELEERVLRAYDLVRAKSADSAWTSDRQPAVRRVLVTREENNYPVYFCVDEPDVPIESLVWITKNIPAAYVIYLYGQSKIDVGAAYCLDPELADGVEQKAIDDLDLLSSFVFQ